MIDLIQYKKGNSELDFDFQKKRKYGEVYYYQKALYSKKGFKWYYFPLNQIKTIELIYGSRQLKQCCGAPIYQTKILLLTTLDQEHIYLNVEETENGDSKRTEALIKKIKEMMPEIEFENYNS